MSKVLGKSTFRLTSTTQFCKLKLHSTSTPSTRLRFSPIPIRAQQPEVSRREASLIAGVLTLVTASPAHALFGIGGNRKEEYQSETASLLENVKSIVSMEKEDPTREDLTSKVRLQTNQWVAKYRRDDNFAGKPSYR